jgi:hypothetical protein
MAGITEIESILESLLGKEHEESRAAQQEFENVIQREADKSLNLVKDRHEDVSQVASEKARILEAMQGNLDRIQEINASPMLQIIEPLAGKFDPQFSRETLARQLATSESRLGILDQSASLRESKRAAEADISKQKVAKAQLTAAGEAEDVEALRARLSDLSSGMAQLSTAEARFLEKADDATIADIASGRKTTTKVTRAQAQREMITRNARQQGIEAADLQLAAAKHNRVVRAVQTLPDEKLKQAKVGGEFPEQLVLEEISRRQQRTLSMKSLAQGIRAKDASLAEAARVNLLNTMTLSETRSLVEQAGTEGIASIQLGDQTLQFTIKELQDHANQFEAANLEIVSDKLLATSADAGLSSATHEWARVLGVPAPVDAERAGVYEIIAKGEFSPEAQNAAAQLAAAEEQLKTATLSPASEVALRQTMLKIATDAVEASKAERLETTPDERKPATKEFFNLGRVETEENAIRSTTSVLVAGGSSGSTFFDTSLLSIRRADAQAAVAESSEAARIQALKFTDPEAYYASMLGQEAIRTQAAVDASNLILFQLYESTAQLLGDEQVVAMLGNPGSDLYKAGRFSERAFFDFLHSRPAPEKEGALAAMSGAESVAVGVNEFVTAARQNAPTHFARLTRPNGRNAAVQASLNLLIWGNTPGDFLSIELDKRLRAGMIPPKELDLTDPDVIRQEFAPFAPSQGGGLF